MRIKNIKLNFMLAAGLVGIVGCSSPVENEQPVSKEEVSLTIEAFDNEGNEHTQTFETVPARVITNNQSSLELLLKLGLEDHIIGTISLDNALPAELQEAFDGIQVLTTTKSEPAKEVVIGNAPDLVIGRVAAFTDENFGTIESLNEVGANVYVQLASQMNTGQSLENILLDIENVGKIFDKEEEAIQLVNELQQKLSTVEETIKEANGETLNVMFMVNYVDGNYGVYGANASLQNDFLARLNAVNVSQQGGQQSLENLIALNPDVIVYVKADKNSTNDEVAIESLLNNELIQSVTAIENKAVFEVTYTELMGYGYRTFDCLESLAKQMYPDLF